MFGELAQLATSRRRLSAMLFSTTLSTTLSTEKQGLLAINRERFYQILKGLYDQGGGGKCISLGSGPRGRRFKSYRPDFSNQQLRGGQCGRLFAYTRFAYHFARLFPQSDNPRFVGFVGHCFGPFLRFFARRTITMTATTASAKT